MRGLTKASGTGFVIEGNRIMTNAHVIANAKYIIIKKNNDPKKYIAYIKHIGHDCDLAILEVETPGFFENTPPLKFKKVLPKINDTVYSYGYPVGGKKASATKGIVSRIDYVKYTQPEVDHHIAIQIDAATNPGNSGGPIIQEGIDYFIEMGAYGAGQSSWGPTFYGLTKVAQSQKFKDKMIEFLEKKMGGVVFIAEPNNRGAYFKITN